MARTEFLQIRLTPEDRKRLEAIAETEHLDLSTWARRELLKIADLTESREGGATPPNPIDAVS